MKRTAIELFAGAGGAALGLQQAGIEALACVEWDDDAVATLRAAGFPAFHADVREWAAPGTRPWAVWSSFPCQGWSTAGKRLGALDERNGWPWTVDHIDELKPVWFMGENVKGLTLRRGASWCLEGGKFLGTPYTEEIPEHAQPWASELRAELSPEQFAAAMTCPHCYLEHVIMPQLRARFAWAEWRVLDAADYGVPQHRRRWVVVAGPRPIEWPAPTHNEDGTDGCARWVSMGEALGITGVLDGMRNTDANPRQERPVTTDEPCVPISTRGNQILRVEGRGNLPQSKRTYTVDEPAPTLEAGSGSHRSPHVVGLPSPTVTTTTEEKGTRASKASNFEFSGGPDRASDALFAGTGRRRLTWQECATLQDFPDGYPFSGSKRSKYRQIGNAVPPTLARVVAAAVIASESPDSPTPDQRRQEKTPMVRKKTPTHVQTVKSNVKGGVDVELGAKTLIYGPNAKGKDSIIQAVELALLGRVTDLAGRVDVGTAVDLFQLAPKDASKLWSEVVLSDGRKASWSVEAKGAGSTKNLEHKPVEGAVYPLRELREVLSKSGTPAQRRFFLDAMASETDDERIYTTLGPTRLTEYDRLRKQAALAAGIDPDSFTGGRALVAVRELAYKEQLSAGRDAKSAQSLVDGIAAAVASPPLESEVAAAKQHAESLYQALQSIPVTVPAVDPAHLQGEIGRAQNMLAGLNAKAQELTQTLSQLKPLDEATREQNGKTRKILESLRTVARAQADAIEAGRSDCCFTCAQKLDAATARVLANHHDAGVDQALHDLDMAEAEDKEGRRVYGELMQVQQSISEWNTFLMQTAEKLRTATTEDPNAGARAAAETTWREAHAKYEGLRSAFDQYATVQRARNQKTQAEDRQDAMKRLVKACDDITADLLGAQRFRFVERVQSYMPAPDQMPDGGTFLLRLEDGTRQVCDVGLDKGERGFLTALSGAEWSIVTLAIACALAETTDFAVIIPEKGADATPETLGKWMSALSTVPAQILLTSPWKYKGAKPKGWTIVNVEKLEEADPEPEEPEEPASRLPTAEDDAPHWVTTLGKPLGVADASKAREAIEKHFGTVELEQEWSQDGNPPQHWFLYSNGGVARDAGDRTFYYAPSGVPADGNGALPKDMTQITSAPLPSPRVATEIPEWAQQPALGKFLAGCAQTAFEATFESHFPGEQVIVEEAVEVGTGTWHRVMNGAVFYKGKGGSGVGLYAGRASLGAGTELSPIEL